MTTFRIHFVHPKNFFVVCVHQRRREITKHTRTTQSNKWKNGEKKFSTKWQRRKNQLRSKRSKNDGFFSSYVFR